MRGRPFLPTVQNVVLSRTPTRGLELGYLLGLQSVGKYRGAIDALAIFLPSEGPREEAIAPDRSAVSTAGEPRVHSSPDRMTCQNR